MTKLLHYRVVRVKAGEAERSKLSKSIDLAAKVCFEYLKHKQKLVQNDQ